MSHIVTRMIGLITVFEAILMGRPSSHNYSVCLRIRWQIMFSNTEFTQFVNRSVKILGRRLYSPSSKDVAWHEDAQLVFMYLSVKLVDWMVCGKKF